MTLLDRIARLLPARLTNRLARYAMPIAIGAVVVLVLAGVAVASLVSPGAVGITALRVSPNVDLDDALPQDLLAQDADRDGLADALENYLYGTDATEWNSSGTGIPDGWLVQHRQDPLSPLVKLARGAAPPADKLPEAYADGYPEAYTPPLSVYYNYGKPADYSPGEDAPWWTQPGAKVADPYNWDQSGKGIATGWLLHYGLDPQTVEPDRVVEGSLGNLTLREAFEHDTDPRKADSDGDGLTDWLEIHVHKTDPSEFSTSGSGVADGWLVHYSLDPFDAAVASADPDLDGVTNLEEFVISHEAFRSEVNAQGLAVLYTRGLHPLDWQTAKTGIPDGWYVRYGLSPFGGDVERVIGKASDWPEVRTYAPEGKPALPDMVMTVRDAYAYGRPSDWDEATRGVWWGGTNPATLDSDEDGIPDPVEIRGWYANLTTDTGPEAKARAYLASSNPLEADSDGDGLTDVEEYRGRASCGGDSPRRFPPTDPRNRDTAFSGLTDLEKVCGAVRGETRYDLYDVATGAGLDPTRADSAGDHMRDGARLQWWHDRYVAYKANPRYPYNGSAFKTLYEWTDRYARFSGMSRDDVLKEMRPDGDADGDGAKNVLDADPSGALHLEKFPEPGAPKTKVFFLGGPEMDPTLYKLTEFNSAVPHAATDPANPDTDGDGLPDAWETRYGRFAPALNGWDLDPSKQDSDGDGTSDADANNDGDSVTWYAYDRRGASIGRTTNSFDYNNGLEFLAGTNPNEVSTANDGVPDGWKAFWGSRIVDTTFPNLLSARDPRVGGVALESAGVIESAITSSPIQPLANLANQFSKATGYVRLENVTSCSTAAAEARAFLKPDEALPVDPCFAGQNLDGKDVKLVRIEGVSKLTYKREAELRTNPYLDDSDGDGAPDAYEAYYLVRSAGGTAYPDPAAADADGAKDPDGDGIGLLDECNSQDGGRTCGTATQHFTRDGETFGRGANPNSADSDQDGIQDGIELIAGLDPLNPADVEAFRSQRDSDFDGVADYLELSGWGKSEFDARLRTDPKNPDTDGDGLLDGNARNLDPSKPADAQVVAWFNALGIAHRVRADGTVDYLGEAELASSLRQEIGAPNRPDDAHAVSPDVPDGWYGYYRGVIQNVRDVDPSLYTAYRPTWWKESAHGVWWWGRAPNDNGDEDLDNDGLNDVTGEDSFPATLSANKLVRGSTTVVDPRALLAFVDAGQNASDVRERAQMLGDGAGNPDGARAAAAARMSANGVPVKDDRAAVAVLDLALPNGTVVTKGRAFQVTGRVVLDEHAGGVPGGTLLQGSESDRVGVGNRTVLVSFFGPQAGRVVGIGVTDAQGRFNLTANVTQELLVSVPPTLKPFGWYNGTTIPALDGGSIAAGDRTGAERNRVVAWVLNTSSTLDASDAAYGSWTAWLPKQGGSAKTTHATGFAVSAPIDVTVRSDTRITTTVASTVENGGKLVGEVVLKDASGAPLADKLVRIRWDGASSPVEIVHLSTDRDGVINLTRENVPISVATAGQRALVATFASADPNLQGSNLTHVVTIRQPTDLVATPERDGVTVGETLLVRGTLLHKSVALDNGGSTAPTPLAGATVRVTLGTATESVRVDDKGAWAARLAVPGTLSPGASIVLVQFEGSETDAPAEVSVPLAVKRTSTLTGLTKLEGPRGIDVTLRGRLVDNEGQGFAGAVVVEANGFVVARGNATDKGSFAVPVSLFNLQLGPQSVRVRFPGDAGHASAENLTTARVTSATTLKLDGAPATLVRGQAFTVRATLLDDANRPVAQQPVALHWRGEPVVVLVTNETGQVSATIPTNATERPAVTQVAAEYVPGPTAYFQPSSAAGDVRVVQGVTLDFANGTARRGPVSFAGTLLDDEGRPIPAASVRVTMGGKLLGEARTARNGTFQLDRTLAPTTPLGPVTVEAGYAGTATLAGAERAVTWHVRTPLNATFRQLGPFVRGEGAPVDGILLDDQGKGADAVLRVKLGDKDAGTLRSAAGSLKGAIAVPADAPRGALTLTLHADATPEHEAFDLEFPIVVKIRPRVEVGLPAVAVRGFSFAGDVALKDDKGQPLRNTTFVYVVGKGSPTFGQTDAEGKATLASVAPLSGQTSLSVTVRGDGDVVAAEYKTAALRVVGPATPIGYFLLVVAVLVVLALVGLVVLAVVLRRRQLEEVRDILDEAIKDLLAGNEYAGTVFLAYRRLSAHLARHGFAEKASDTPREFAVGIRKAVPIGGEPLKALVQLFEEARYSDHPIGSRERDAAVRSLSAVRGELDRVLGKKEVPA